MPQKRRLTAVPMRRKPSDRRTIQPFVELKTTVAQIKAIMLFGGKISLFANLCIGNTESYVFLAAKTTYVERSSYLQGSALLFSGIFQRDYPMPQRITNKVGLSVQCQFVHQVGAMRLSRAGADT